MELPLGLRVIGRNNPVYKLSKSFYGLKRSSQAWYTKLSSKLIEEGFTRCIVHHSLFIRSDHEDTTIIVMYMDDIIITENSETRINRAKDILKKHFDMKDLRDYIIFWD